MKKLSITLLLIFTALMSSSLQAQKSNSRGIDPAKWEKIAEKYDYSKEKEEKKQPEKEKKEIKATTKSVKLSPQLKEFIKYSLFVIVIIILVFIGYRLIVNGKFWDNKKLVKPKVYTIDNLEENLNEADIDSFLDDALKNNNFRLSIRLMYLNILKALSKKELIKWKKDKTNGDYLQELYHHNLYRDFNRCTLAYEYIWFSELDDFNKTQYEQIKPAFDQLLAAIK